MPNVNHRTTDLVAGMATIALLLAASPGHAQPPAALVRVDTVKVEPLIQTVPVIGRVVARREGEVAARIQGPLSEFPVRVGDRVAAGEVIARIDDNALAAALAQARGRLGEARARISTAEAQLALARQERNRLAKLKNTQATSEALFEDAVQNEAIARARVRETQAAVATAQADVRLAEIDLGYSLVAAPYAGVVVQRMGEAGAYVSKGSALVRLIADEDMEVEADVPFDRLAALEAGVSVEVTLDDGERHPARVRSVIPQEDRLSRTRAVRFQVDFASSAQRLADGQTATVHVPIGRPRDVVSVHKDGINRRAGGTFVYVVEDGSVTPRTVELGTALGNRFEVLSGVEPGAEVVVRGNERLRPGDKVRVGNDAKPAS